MQDVNLLIALFMGLGITLVLASFYYHESKTKNPYLQTSNVMEKYDPEMWAFRAKWESYSSKCREQLALQLANEMRAIRGLITECHSLAVLAETLRWEYAKYEQECLAILASHNNRRVAHEFSTKQGLRLEFYEQLTFALSTGEMGKTLSETARRQLLDQLEIEKQKTLDDWNFKLSKRAYKWEQGRDQ